MCEKDYGTERAGVPLQTLFVNMSVKVLVPYYLLRSKTKFLKKYRRGIAKREFENAIRSAPENAIAIDCGANVGNISDLFLRNGMRVHAFEPDPVASNLLIERHGKNSSFLFHPAAVGIQSSYQKLFRRKTFDENPEYWTMSSSLLQRKVCDESNSVEVEVIDFIEYLRNIPERISILKMDIEGAEIDILEKLLETGLHRKIDFIFVETHERISLNCAIRTALIRAKIRANRYSNFNLDHN